jgi:bacterioferritin-associated ferredoxin
MADPLARPAKVPASGVPALIVCQCRRVTDRQVKTAVERGADDLESLGRACGAGTDCRGCHATLEMLLDDGRRAALPVAGDPRRLLVVAAA